MSEDKKILNTYDFDKFCTEDQQKELRRLEKQALLVSALEKDALIGLDLPQGNLS